MASGNFLALGLTFCVVGVTFYLIWELIVAVRDGYFPDHFLTGWLFRDADRHEQPVLFWFVFPIYLARMLIFFGVSTLFVRVIASTLIERIAH